MQRHAGAPRDALRPHGRGGYVGVDGERYDGGFARGVRAGRGVWRLPGGDEYFGDWGENQRHGRGMLWLAAGCSYEGGFEAGWRSGQGLALVADGSSYEGPWTNDVPPGVGAPCCRPTAEVADLCGCHDSKAVAVGLSLAAAPRRNPDRKLEPLTMAADPNPRYGQMSTGCAWPCRAASVGPTAAPAAPQSLGRGLVRVSAPGSGSGSGFRVRVRA